jgi:hypothetical protein
MRAFSTNIESPQQPAKPTQPESAAKDATNPPPNQEATSRGSSIRKMDFDEYDDYQEPKTAREKVNLYLVIGARLGLFVLGAVCIYFTAKELFPGRLNPQSLFSEVFEYLRYKEEVCDVFC